MCSNIAMCAVTLFLVSSSSSVTDGELKDDTFEGLPFIVDYLSK